MTRLPYHTLSENHATRSTGNIKQMFTSLSNWLYTVVMCCLIGQDSYYPTRPVFQARSNNVAETLRKFKSHPHN